MKIQVAYRLLGTRYIWKFQFANSKPRMETWQLLEWETQVGNALLETK